MIDIDLIWVSGEAEYFCEWDWTEKITEPSLIYPVRLGKYGVNFGS